MVVMEHLPGSPAHELFCKGPLPSSVFKDVQAAIDSLHEMDLVFGDLRRPNIVVLNKRAKIVDFDWCGRDGEDRYPPNLNNSGEINWHPDVGRGSVMRKEHNHFMLDGLRPFSLTEIAEDGEFEVVV